MIFSVFCVLLLPSHAYSAGDGPGYSGVSSRSLDHCGTSPQAEPTPDEPATVCVTTTATATATATATETATVTATETQTVIEQGEAACGTSETPPCAVQLDENGDPWIKVTAALGVALLGTIAATLFGQGH